ncbi:Diaminohydroxyphosphoribosylamino-pyrimidine deaminase [Neolecta irregularis DAH-3]|uniref:Diaminohydroxyphosphoribosylamino-pyrimidine deaminase n=1 Tax=Neolecta irregularis (strain DAH-3) TaxID=1198029 RepID=A0A1U7LMM7_NEOID|nr:Diaminohydroxyphosphoribosylamino-pyrimidine deaminase [Neolecta irregularis DAH-3]|eukprot:OLL23771.1 Diaminohydroxyphosphoribosylamino-pyrimidine deaminase [Neolecta irregularis DAH-3]
MPSDLEYMRLALSEANKCKPTRSAFCVGAVLVKHDRIISTGYSRELDGNTHAEECAFLKLSCKEEAKGCTMYTTMEPCGPIRLSGKKPCTQWCIEAGVEQVVIGVREPGTFVKCEGIEMLRSNRIQVFCLNEMESECLKVATRGHI